MTFVVKLHDMKNLHYVIMLTFMPKIRFQTKKQKKSELRKDVVFCEIYEHLHSK